MIAEMKELVVKREKLPFVVCHPDRQLPIMEGQLPPGADPNTVEPKVFIRRFTCPYCKREKEFYFKGSMDGLELLKVLVGFYSMDIICSDCSNKPYRMTANDEDYCRMIVDGNPKGVKNVIQNWKNEAWFWFNKGNLHLSTKYARFGQFLESIKGSTVYKQTTREGNW